MGITDNITRKCFALAALAMLAMPGTTYAEPRAVADPLVIDSSSLLFSDENGEGYRLLTSIEPEAGDTAPLTDLIVERNTEVPEGLEVSYSSEEGPAVKGTERTLIVHTTIPLAP